MAKNKWFLLLLIVLGLVLAGCGVREGTIVYDVDFPNADSCDASGNCDDGSSGASSDGGSDNASAGFTLSKTTATVSETGSTDTFTVVLDSLPSADVVFGVSDDDSDNSELSLSTASLTFGTGNWSTAQTITLTGLDDSDVDGNVSSTVTVAVSFSADTNYAGLSAQTVSVTTIDNDSAGFTLSKTTATVSENGSTDSFSIVLNNSPTADVSFSLSDNSELSLSTTSLTFGTGNWSTAQTITLTGLDDNDLDGDVVSTVTVSVGSSADTNYVGLSAQTVSVTTQDDELASVTWDEVTPGEQQIELTWLAYSGADNYTIYWNTSGSVDNNSSSFSEISGTASTSCPGEAPSCLSYNHGGLNSSAYYYYRIVANVSGKLTELSTEENASPLALSCTPSYTHDNDSDLLVYYDFNNNLEDQIDNYSDGRYDLTNTGGTIRFPAGCSDGLAGYFDSTSGYAYNNNFNDDNNSDLFESGNFTISMWFYADQDMAEYSSLMSSKQLAAKSNDGGNWSFQLDADGNDKIRWRSAQGTTSDSRYSTHTVTSNTYSKSQWTHAAFVKHDNGTSQIYLNGVLEVTSSETQNTPLDSLRIGINRYTDGNSDGKWKGYIDEVKVYGRALSEQEVVGACAAYTECKIPTNLSVTAGVEQNSLSWDAVSGATDYKIYWNTTGNVDSSSSSITVNGATTYDHLSRTGGTTYYYRVSSVVDGVESALSVQQSATPLGSTTPTLTAADNETQQVTINWDPVAGVDNYTIFWDTVSFTDNNSSNQILKVLGSSSGSVCSSGTCSYVHGGRDNGTTYYYRVAAVSAGGVAGTRSNEASGIPRSFDGDPNCPRPTPNSDTDPALLVYYDFNAGLVDQHRKYSDGRYDLSGADGFNLISAGSCFAGNRAGYFDSSGGYAFNDNFTSDNETSLQDNFTISLWFNADQDMVDFSSLMSSRYVPETGSDNDVWSFQIDSARRKKVSQTWTNGPWIRFRSAKGDARGDIDLYSQNQYHLHQWHHLAFVKYDNGTAVLYLDNVSSSENFDTSKMSSNIPPWSTLKIGTNRREEFNWKGYIDEFKVYGRALDADDVSNLYTRDYP